MKWCAIKLSYTAKMQKKKKKKIRCLNSHPCSLPAYRIIQDTEETVEGQLNNEGAGHIALKYELEFAAVWPEDKFSHVAANLEINSKIPVIEKVASDLCTQ